MDRMKGERKRDQLRCSTQSAGPLYSSRVLNGQPSSHSTSDRGSDNADVISPRIPIQSGQHVSDGIDVNW